jgi:ribosomal-protein-alanine N-acetyltransferase
MTFNPFPTIKTERLLLRKIEESDCDDILFLRSDPTVNKFIERPENRQTKNRADAEKFIKELHEGIENNKTISWGISLKGDHKIIGTICLWNFSENNKRAEVGYDLNPIFHRKGIMNEALKQIIDFGLVSLNLAEIEAFTHSENKNSIKLLTNNGFNVDENRKDEDNTNNQIFVIKKVSN